MMIISHGDASQVRTCPSGLVEHQRPPARARLRFRFGGKSETGSLGQDRGLMERQKAGSVEPVLQVLVERQMLPS